MIIKTYLKRELETDQKYPEMNYKIVSPGGGVLRKHFASYYEFELQSCNFRRCLQKSII